MKNDTQTEPINDEQAADLANMMGAATEGAPVPGQGAQAGAEQGSEPAQTIGQEITGAIAIAVQILAPAFPSLTEIYTPEVSAAAGESMGRVCDKHGWLQGGLFGKWGEEIACIAVCGPLAVATYQGINADLKAAREKAGAAIDKAKAPAPGALAQPGARTVTIGNPTPTPADANA